MFWLGPWIDARGLAASRMLLGIAIMAVGFEASLVVARGADEGRFALRPFEWLPHPGEAGATTLLAVFGITGVCLVLGLFPRFMALLAALAGVSILLIDLQAYSNHLVLAVCLLLVMAGARSADAWALGARARRRAAGGGPNAPGGMGEVPSWPAFLLLVQITTVYFWTAVSKLNPQYLSGEVIQLNLRMPLDERLLPWLAAGSIGLEFFLAVGLWIQRLRPLAFVGGALLHGGIVFMLRDPVPLVVFATLMGVGYAPAVAAYRAARRDRAIGGDIPGTPTRSRAGASPRSST